MLHQGVESFDDAASNNEINSRAKHDHVRVIPQKCHLLFETMWFADIVGVHARNVVGA